MSNNPYPNSQANPAAATPVWQAPPPVGSGLVVVNVAANQNTQLKTGPGTFLGLSVNSAGTTSTAKLYDGVSSIVTVTIATPGVFSWVGHPLVAGDAIVLTTTGALPTGLTAGTPVYVSTVGLTANAFTVADTRAHALAGTNTIATSGSQSGVQTAWQVQNPLGAYDTTKLGPSFPGPGWPFSRGLIMITAGGAAADVTASLF